MRNLKRALSLTLASVMLLGMMVIGTSAVAGYSDVDEDDNVEAIEVLQAIEVMVGDDRGFGPDRPVNRAEMAVVMGLLLNLDYNYYVSTCPFADVSGNYEWARGWVGACAANGIVSGRGEGIYDPAATVTAIEAASMMMRALGYFQNAEDYNDGFVLVTVRQGNQIGLFNGVGSDGSTPMTRNQVAQMALNALRSEMVDFTGTPGIEVNGVKVGYRAEYTPRTSTEAKYNAIEGRTSDVVTGDNHKGQYYIQLGEELYDGDLRLDNDETDVFGRPARQWDYKGEEIGTYAKKELMRKSWTVGIEGGDVYSGVGAAASEDYDLFYWVNGLKKTDDEAKEIRKIFERRNDDSVVTTGKGVLTEAYVDVDKEELTIVEIHTYLAYANNDYDARNHKLSITVYEDLIKSDPAVIPQTASEKTFSRSLSGDDFAVEDYEQDDLMLVTFAGAKKEIQSVAEPQVVADVYINSYSTGKQDDDDKAYMMNSVTADGTKYDASEDAVWDPDYLYNYATTANSILQMKDHRYNLYLDQYGYVIGLENVKANTNYAFLIGYQAGSDVLAKADDKALVILIDEETGTAHMETVVAKRSNLGTDDAKQLFSADGTNYNYTNGYINKWITYTMDGDVMVLESAVDTQYHDDYTASQVIDRDNVTLEGDPIESAKLGYSSTAADALKYGNTKTVYVAVDTDTSVVTNGSIVDINDVVTGVRNAHIEFVAGTTNASGAYVLYEDGSSYIKYAVVVGESSGNKNFVYLTSKIKQADRDDEKDKDIFIYEGFINDTWYDRIESLVSWEGASRGGANLVEGVLYEAKINADGRITRMDAMADNWDDAKQTENRDEGYVQATSSDSAFNGNNDLDYRYGKLWLKDDTLYIQDDSTNDNYVQLAEKDVKFYIKGSDEKGKMDSSYELYTNAKSAMNRLGAKQGTDLWYFTGTFVAICDDSGFATTIIIRDEQYETNGSDVDDDDVELGGYVVGYLGNSKGSKNVQVVIGQNKEDGSFGHWLTKAEIEALKITVDDVYVENAGTEIKTKFGLGQEGSVYTKPTDVGDGTKYNYQFDKSPLAVFDLWAYDGKASGGANDLQPGAGFLKIHLESALGDGVLKVRIRINGEVAGLSGSDPTIS